VKIFYVGIGRKGNAMKDGEVSHVFLQETLYRKVFSTRLRVPTIPQIASKLKALGLPEERRFRRVSLAIPFLEGRCQNKIYHPGTL